MHFLSCEYNDDSGWQLLYDFWMDLLCRALHEDVQSQATQILRHRLIGEDRSLLCAPSEYRTPPELRPSWAIPPVKLKWSAPEDHLTQVSSQYPQCSTCDDTQTATQHGDLDFLE